MLSLDGIIMDFYDVPNAVIANLNITVDVLSARYKAKVSRRKRNKPGTFIEQIHVELKSGNAFWIGIGLNGTKKVWNRCRLDANPNKVGSDPVFKKVLQFLCSNTAVSQRKITRFDLAIDLPIPREHCFLVKDHRLYIERQHGQEWTQYLGAKSSKIGRVKLYNKQIEANLDTPLTRLELTLDPATPYEDIPFPAVFFFDPQELRSSGLKLTATDDFILNALLQGCGSLHSLCRKTKEKMKTLLNTYVHRVEIDETHYTLILDQLEAYRNGNMPS